MTLIPALLILLSPGIGMFIAWVLFGRGKPNKKKIRLFRAKYSMLFWDCLFWLVGGNWQKSREESRGWLKLLKDLYEL